MRRQYLIRSVSRHLPAGERVLQVAFMWQRHRWMPLYTACSLVGLTVLATVVGFETWALRLAIGLAGAAIAGSATSSYWVLAQTSAGLVWLKGSRIRQRAVELVRRLPSSTEISRLGGSILAHEWRVDGQTYSVMRSYDSELQAMAGPPTADPTGCQQQ